MDVPLAARTALAGVLVVAGVVVVLLTRRAADGRLARSQVAGLRTRALLSSDAAWRRGHEAARPHSDLSGGGLVVAGVASVLTPGVAAWGVVVLAAAAWSVGWLLAGTVHADRVVRRELPDATAGPG